MKVKEWLRHSKLFKRAMLFLFSFMIIFSEMLPVFGVQVEKATSTVSFWRWDRFDKVDRSKYSYTRALFYRDGYATANVTYNNKRIYMTQIDNPNVDWNAEYFITTTDLGAFGMKNDGGGMGNEWIFYYPGTNVEVVSCDDSDMTFRWGGGWEDGDHGYYFDNRGSGWVGILHRAESHWYDNHYNNGWYSYGNKLECESCKNADDHKEPSFLCYMGRQIKFSAITRDKSSPLTISAGSVLNINDEVVLQSTDDNKLAGIYIKEGGVMTVEGRFYFNGWIKNEGTIIINSGACMMPFDPPGPDGELCNIEINGGDLVVMDGGVLSLKETSGIIKLTNGGSLVNNGKIILPHGFTNSDSTVYNREGAYMWIGYYMEAGMTNLSDKTVQKDSGGNYYLSGMTAVSGSAWASYDAGDDITSFLKNDGYIRIARTNMMSASGKGHDATSDGAKVLTQKEKAAVDAARKAAYQDGLLTLDQFKNQILKPAYESALKEYNADILSSTKRKAYSEAKAAYDNPTPYYNTYCQSKWQEALQKYPYSDSMSIGTTTSGQ